MDLLRKNKDQKCPITGALRSMCDMHRKSTGRVSAHGQRDTA